MAADAGDVALLKELIDNGNEAAADRLSALAVAAGDEGLLAYLVDCGHEEAADRWAEIASARGDLETLRRLVDEGSDVATALLRAAIPTPTSSASPDHVRDRDSVQRGLPRQTLSRARPHRLKRPLTTSQNVLCRVVGVGPLNIRVTAPGAWCRSSISSACQVQTLSSRSAPVRDES